MTFLELCQMTRQEMGISGSGPASVAGQVGIEKRIVDWVRDAWLEIQGMHRDWRFLAGEFEFPTITDTNTYTPASIGLTNGVAYWAMDTISCRVNTADEGLLEEMDYTLYRRTLALGTQPKQRPQKVARTPANALLLWPTPPDDSYTIRGEYYRKPQTLAANADEPIMPSEYHRAIVYLAMQYYGRNESAVEVLVDGKDKIRPIMSRMEIELLPDLQMGGPLV